MLVHGPRQARPYRRCSLELRSAPDESTDRPIQRDLACGAIDSASARNELIDRRSAVGNDHRNTARPCLGGDQAEGLRLATVNQRIGACEQPRQLVPVGNPRKDHRRTRTVGEQFELGTLGPVPDQQQSDVLIPRRASDCTKHHVPALFGGKSPKAD